MLSVLCVCTYNRTRSVMMEALLDRHLRDLGLEATVRSAGTRADGGLATGETVKLLGERGLDLRGHRGTPLDDDIVDSADLIITAEQDHVVHIASHWPDAFDRTFTLPELLTLTKLHGGRLGAPIEDWLELLADGRPSGFTYLDDRSIGEVVDPTGQDRRTWLDVFELVDDLTRRLALALT
jgi:protein-tyrosine phosphatase